VGATAVTELLKRTGVVAPAADLLWSTGPSWPSSHAAAVTALGGGLLLVPRRPFARAAIAVVAIVAIVVTCASLVITRSHRPTDVVGGVLIAATVCAVVASLLERFTELSAAAGRNRDQQIPPLASYSSNRSCRSINRIKNSTNASRPES
jgi:membrane-associated phospholipid phosphatase